jgi:hypothetical protein
MDTFDRTVPIGPEFFGKAFGDYSDRFWAFAREIMQNSLDCGSTMIHVVITESESDNATWVTVQNNGAPMTEEILVHKLLSLGSSGKDFKAGAVGGFGKAKEILYFAHRDYSIHSGGHKVTGSGAGYTLRQTAFQHGTTSQVVWNGLHGDRLKLEFTKFVQFCGFAGRCKFTVKGELVKPTLKTGEVQRTLKTDQGEDWAEIRLAKQFPGLLVVRIGGVPMYSTWCKFGGSVVVDLLGTSASKLTSNRDGCKYPYSGYIADFTTQIAVDTSSAFTLEKASFTHFAGPKLASYRQWEPAPVDPAKSVQAVDEAVAAWVGPHENTGAGILVRVTGRTENHPWSLQHEFIVKNCVRRAVPAEFHPDSLQFSDHARWLIRAYAGCLVTLYELHEIHNEPFTVGFVLSEDVIAEVATTPEHGLVYYLNPCVITRKRHKRRYTKATRHQILSAAAHEFIHGARGRSWHDETFASILTETMTVVLRNYSKFTKRLI